MTRLVNPYLGDPDRVGIGQVLGYRIAEATGHTGRAPSTRIEIRAPLCPGTACTLLISPYMLTPSGEDAHSAVIAVDAITTPVAIRPLLVTMVPSHLTSIL